MNSPKRILVIGLGYVGLPLAVALARRFSVVGHDGDSARITQLRDGIDRTGEVANDVLSAARLELTDEPGTMAGIIEGLRGHGFEVDIHDPLADADEAARLYDIRLLADLTDAQSYDAVVAAVAHTEYRGFTATAATSWCGVTG